MQETGQKAVMLSFRLPAAERDAFKAWCAERHTTGQAVLRGDVARHLTTEPSAAIPPERALAVLTAPWPTRTLAATQENLGCEPPPGFDSAEALAPNCVRVT